MRYYFSNWRDMPKLFGMLFSKPKPFTQQVFDYLNSKIFFQRTGQWGILADD